ncbi:T9SS type A sorting domain-containing protein [bacterium]|nr:T9SS type A sorting domain-containing protein [bacterium]
MPNIYINKPVYITFYIFLFLSFIIPITPLRADISGVTAVLGTNTVNTASTYTLTFTTGGSGALSAAANDTIIITFPQNTNVPANINPGSQVTVNGSDITTAAAGSGQVLTITTPVDILDSTFVTVIITTGAQLINPSLPGTTYTLDVHTSIEGTDVSSGNYTILASSTTLNVGTVVPNPATLGNYAEYTISVTLSSDGAIWGGNSEIIVGFPVGTDVPSGGLSVTGITVDGTTVDSAIGAGQQITLIPNQDINGSSSFDNVFPVSLQIRNPTSTGIYTLDVSTSAQPAGTSSNYNISLSSTTVNVTGVTPNPATIGNYANYTILFITSADGALTGGSSEILIVFPADTMVPNGALTNVTVNGTSVSSANGTTATRLVTIIPSQDINGSTTVTVLIPDSALRNPTSAGSYNLTVETTPQPLGTSSNYDISLSSTPVNVTAVTPNPGTIGNYANYTISFTTSADGALIKESSEIIIVFPNDTIVSNGALAGVTVNGAPPFSANGNSGTRTVTIIPASNIGVSTGVTVFIPSSALANPGSSGNYSLSVATTVQPVGTSPLYAIGLSSNSINVTSAVPAPSVAGNDAVYTIIFDTSFDGALAGGSSEIIVGFPNDTEVTGGSLSGIIVNGVGASSANGNVPSQRYITIIPTQNLAGGSTVSLSIPDTALRNPTLAGNYTLSVATSVQPAGTSPAYSIGQSAIPIVVTNVTPSPDTPGSGSDYTITFSTSSDGPLIGGDSLIIVTFPADTVVSQGSLSGVTVDGTAADSAVGNSISRSITIVLQQDINGSNIQLYIPNALQNPTQTGNYTLTVETSPQPVGTSLPYLIQISSTPVTVNSVLLTTNIVNTSAGYTVNCTLNVVLRSQKSSFFMIFPYNTEVPNGSISGVVVNGVAAHSASGNSGTRTITVVPAADVSPSAAFPIVIPDTTILNPSIPSTAHSLGVSTTAQPLGTQTYTIQASTTRISNVSVVPSPSRAGQTAAYTVNFNVGAYGCLGQGNIITVEFPAGTGLPASFSSGNILVNSIGNTGTVYPVNQVVKVLIPPGVTVANHGGVIIVLSGISNPGVGFYRLNDVHTDAEPFPVSSPYYWITADSQITLGQVLVSPDVINANAQYTINFILGLEGSLSQNVDKIFLSFSTNTSMPLMVNPADITVNGTAVSSAVLFSTYSIEILSPIDISASASDKSVQVVFQTAFGITNPPLPGTYTLSAYTTIENTVVTSDSYQINPSTNTHLTSPQVQLSPLFTNSYGRYDIQCQTGSLGGLVKDISTIDLVFPDDFNIPGGIVAGKISINNQPLTTAVSITNHTLTLTTPVDIASAGSLEIIIETAAHIRNPLTAGDYSLSLYTSSEPTPMESNSLHIARATWKDVVSYPNPLKLPEARNKNFTFLFIPEQSATLRIYTLDGKLVRTLTKNDPSDRMVWDLNNEKGQQIASGIYIYKIFGPGGERKGKLAIMK